MGEKTLGDVVRDARQTADMTQEELAAAAGVSRAMLQNLERGRTSPRRAQLRRIASALGTDVATLMARAHADEATGLIGEAGALAGLTPAEAVLQRHDLEGRLARLDQFATPGTAAYGILREALETAIDDLNRVIHKQVTTNRDEGNASGSNAS